MKGLDIGSRHIIQTLKEASAKSPQPQLSKCWTVTENLLDSLQLLLITIYLAIVRLIRQQPNLAVPRDKTCNQP